jgi:hypothetical protein
MEIRGPLLDCAIWRRSPRFFALNLRALASGHRPVHADPADQKRFQEVQRVTADEQFGGGTQAAHFGAGGVLDQLQGENRTPPLTRHIVHWIAWAQRAVDLLLLWCDAPIPPVLKFP